ncbi:MAG: hypothetical protein J5898_01535 [Lachnospiraceae bacterium]|nr:hypothetical protein [Lachnospiraceae bacterium]
MRCIKTTVFLLLSFVIQNSFMYAYDFATEGQMKFMLLCSKTHERLKAGQKVDREYLVKNVKPLLDEALDESIPDEQVWDNHLINLNVPSFSHFLDPQTGQYKNPFFTYALSRYCTGNRFKKSNLQQKQNACSHVLAMLGKDEYIEFHPFILRILFNHFYQAQYYTPNCRKYLIERKIMHKDWRKIPKILLLLALFDRSQFYLEGIPSVKANADACNSYNRKNLLSWYSLILFAKQGYPEYIDKLLQIVNQLDRSESGMRTATYIFPCLTFVQDIRVIELMKSFLADDRIIDQGDDIMHRYTGFPYLAAMTLYTMIEGFPQFSTYEFKEQDRLRCLDWMNTHPDYTFRKIDYQTNDPVIMRMKYMIFEAN